MSSQSTGGVERRVNSYTTDSQLYPTITALVDGGWLVTWQTSGQTGIYSGIAQRRFDSFGHAVGDEVLVNTFTTNYQVRPVTTALADGGWVVVWSSNQQDGDGYGVFQQRYDADGATVGAAVPVNAFTTSDQSQPGTTALADGGWLVAWASVSQDGSQAGVFQKRYGPDGKAVESEAQVNIYTTGAQTSPRTAALPDGGWIVVWASDGQDGSSFGVYQRRYDSDGNTLSGEIRVNTYTADSQGASAVVALADGGWLVLWSSAGQDGSSSGVYQQRYDVDGFAVGGESRVNTYTTDNQTSNAATALADGGWLVTWQSFNQDGNNNGIYQQRYDSDGHAIGGETRVNIYTTSAQEISSVAGLADGGWIVTWYSDQGNPYDIYQRHFANDIRGGSKADRLVGTHWDEMLIGFGGNDRLDGKGGDDILIGGFGNDTYIVNSKNDAVQEIFAIGGLDQVLSSVSYSIRLSAFVENLSLTGGKNLNATGNSGSNTLTGNSGDNNLAGLGRDDTLKGATGDDRLTGGKGVDTFVFKTGWDHDTIRDFDAKGSDHDLVDLSGLNSIANFADLMAHHVSVLKGDILINGGGGDVLVLEGVKLADLDGKDFIF